VVTASASITACVAEKGGFDESDGPAVCSRLCDMHAEIADVVPMAEVFTYCDQCPPLLTPVGPPAAPAPSIRDAAE